MKQRIDNINLNFEKTGKDGNQYDGIDIRAVTTVDAKYARVPGYEDDPDICALPVIEKYRRMKDRLTTLPRHYDPEDIKKMDSYERKRGLKSLFELNYPLGHFFDLYEMIYKCLFDSYALRKSWKSDEDGSITSLQLDAAGRAPCILFVGVTGSGKTVAARQVMSMFPMSIRHIFDAGEYIQIPILFTTVSIGNLFSVLLALASRLDEITDMGMYHKAKMRRAKNIGIGCSVLSEWIGIYHIGMIIIDESQFMDFGRGKTSIENLIAVSEETGCSICLIGNYEVQNKIRKYPRLLSRIGDNVLETKCSTESDRKLLQNLLFKLWGYNWTGHETQLTKGLADTIMSESMYNVSVMKNLVIMIQFEAINSWPEDGITADFVREVARKHFSELQTALFRDTPEDDRRMMEILEEHTRLIDDSIEKDKAKKKVVAAVKTGKDSIAPENIRKFEDAWELLMEDGYLKNDAERAFRLAMANNADLQHLKPMEIYNAVLKKLTKSAKQKAAEKKAELEEKANGTE